MTDDTPMKAVTNCETGETVYLPLSAEEIEASNQARIAFEALEAQRIAEENAKEALKASARAKLISGQPLTEEEANTIVL